MPNQRTYYVFHVYNFFSVHHSFLLMCVCVIEWSDILRYFGFSLYNLLLIGVIFFTYFERTDKSIKFAAELWNFHYIHTRCVIYVLWAFLPNCIVTYSALYGWLDCNVCADSVQSPRLSLHRSYQWDKYGSWLNRIGACPELWRPLSELEFHWKKCKVKSIVYIQISFFPFLLMQNCIGMRMWTCVDDTSKIKRYDQ